MLQPHQAERAIRYARRAHRPGRLPRRRSRTPPRIAYDEWNVWYRDRRPATLAERYTFADALAVATYLNIFVRNCAPGPDGQPGADGERDRPDRHHRRDGGRPADLLPRSCCTPGRRWTTPSTCTSTGPPSVPGCREAPSRWPHRVADLGPFPLVDAAASVSTDRGRIAVTLVNRSPDDAEDARARAARLRLRRRRPRSPRVTDGSGRARAARVLPDVDGSAPGRRLGDAGGACTRRHPPAAVLHRRRGARRPAARPEPSRARPGARAPPKENEKQRSSPPMNRDQDTDNTEEATTARPRRDRRPRRRHAASPRCSSGQQQPAAPRPRAPAAASSPGRRGASPSASATVEAGANCASSSAMKITFWAWVPGLGRAVTEFNKTHPGICVTQEDVGAGDPEYVAITNAHQGGLRRARRGRGRVRRAPLVRDHQERRQPRPVRREQLQERLRAVGLAGGQPGQRASTRCPATPARWRFYYNAPLLAKYHITPPTTWAQFATDAAKLHKDDPSAYLTNFSATDLQWIMSLMAQDSAWPFSYTGGSNGHRSTGPARRRWQFAAVLAEAAVRARASTRSPTCPPRRSPTWTRASTRAGSARPGARPTSRPTRSRRSATGAPPACRSGPRAPTSRRTGAAPPTRSSPSRSTRRRRPSSPSG